MSASRDTSDSPVVVHHATKDVGRSQGKRESLGEQPRTRPRPIAIRSSIVPRDADAEKAMRKRVTQGLPKARRLIIRNRIELCVPPGFSQPNPPIQTLAPPRHGSRFVEENPSEQTNQLISEEHPRNDTEAHASMQAIQPAIASMLVGSPVTFLGAGRVDPFGNYPVKLTRNEHWILDQINIGPNPVYKTFRKAWLPVAIQDPATFHQLLANIALNIPQLNNDKCTNVLSVNYHSQALRKVNTVLSDPQLNTCDAVVASIATFVCYSVHQQDWDAFSAHLDGLQNIVNLRGGWGSFSRLPVLRCMIFGVDLSGACRRDCRPRFQLPEGLINYVQSQVPLESSLSENGSRSLWEAALPPRSIVPKAFEETRKAIEYIKYKSSRDELWIEVRTVVFWIDPVVHTLMGQGTEYKAADKSMVIQEVARLGLVLFLFKIRRLCGQLGVHTKLFVTKLKDFVSAAAYTVDWAGSVDVLLWALFMGMTESLDRPENIWYLKSMATVVKKIGFGSWDELLMRVRGLLWIDEVFNENLEKCQAELEGAWNR